MVWSGIQRGGVRDFSFQLLVQREKRTGLSKSLDEAAILNDAPQTDGGGYCEWTGAGEEG